MMNERMITFDVEDRSGSIRTIEIPSDISLNLMEALKASEYPVLATCGGMALCATCHVEIKRGEDSIGRPNNVELDMIDTLPNAVANSRLACQIRVGEHIQGALFSLKEDHE